MIIINIMMIIINIMMIIINIIMITINIIMIIIMLTSGRKVNVEMVLQVPVSLILVTCSVTWGLSNHHEEDTGEDDDDGEDEDEDDDGDGDGDLGYAQMKLAFGCMSAILGKKSLAFQFSSICH